MMLRHSIALLFLGALGCGTNPVSGGKYGPVIIAHRGASALAPEHTVAAYDRAIADGADYIEQDIARTKDGVLVVIHDATLDRTARGPAADCSGAVRDKTLEQLRRCDFGSWFNERYPDRAVPSYPALKILTLSEVIDRYRGKAGFYIEIKNPELYPDIESQLASMLVGSGLSFAHEFQPDAFVQSFSSASLQRLHSIEPRIPLIQLLGPEPVHDPVATVMAIEKYAQGIALPGASMPDWVVEMSHMWCLAVHPYGVEDSTMMRGLLTRTVDGIITDRPDVLRDVISSMEPLVLPYPRCGIPE